MGRKIEPDVSVLLSYEEINNLLSLGKQRQDAHGGLNNIRNLEDSHFLGAAGDWAFAKLYALPFIDDIADDKRIRDFKLGPYCVDIKVSKGSTLLVEVERCFDTTAYVLASYEKVMQKELFEPDKFYVHFFGWMPGDWIKEFPKFRGKFGENYQVSKGLLIKLKVLEYKINSGCPKDKPILRRSV